MEKFPDSVWQLNLEFPFWQQHCSGSRISKLPVKKRKKAYKLLFKQQEKLEWKKQQIIMRYIREVLTLEKK
jgi:hypothetical protein